MGKYTYVNVPTFKHRQDGKGPVSFWVKSLSSTVDRRVTIFFTIRGHFVCLSTVEKNCKQNVFSITKKTFPLSCLFLFKNSVIVQILMWSQLLQILNGRNTTFPFLFIANTTVGSVSWCKKLMHFQTAHIRTPTWRDTFSGQSHHPPRNREVQLPKASQPAALAPGQLGPRDTAVTGRPGAGRTCPSAMRAPPQTQVQLAQRAGTCLLRWLAACYTNFWG